MSLLAACISTSDTRRASSQEGDFRVSYNWQLPMCAVFRNKILSSNSERQPRTTETGSPRLGVSLSDQERFPMESKRCFGFCCFFLLTVDVVYVSDSCGDYYHIKLCSSFKWECLYRHIDISMLANTLLIALTIFSLINSFIIQPLFSCLFLSISVLL